MSGETAMSPRELNDLEMMRDPNLWPHMLLPIKRWKEELRSNEYGYLVSADPIVYLGNIFEARTNNPSMRYDSLEAIVADGWRVD